MLGIYSESRQENAHTEKIEEKRLFQLDEIITNNSIIPRQDYQFLDKSRKYFFILHMCNSTHDKACGAKTLRYAIENAFCNT